MAVDYTALMAAWASTALPTGVSGTPLSSGMTTAQKLAAVNGWTVAGPAVDVQVSSVVGYLGLNAKLSVLQTYATTAVAGTNGATTQSVTAARELMAIIDCPNAPSFQMSSAEVYSTIQGMLSALEGDSNSGITGSDATALLGLSASTEPWWQAAGYTSPFNSNDLAAAGGLS
jgi:hypothetical protein